MSFILGRIGLGFTLVTRGLGYADETPPPPPSIIVGLCVSGLMGDVQIAEAMGDPATDGAMLPDPSISGAMGDVMIAGTLSDASVEGTAINVC